MTYNYLLKANKVSCLLMHVTNSTHYLPVDSKKHDVAVTVHNLFIYYFTTLKKNVWSHNKLYFSSLQPLISLQLKEWSMLNE